MIYFFALHLLSLVLKFIVLLAFSLLLLFALMKLIVFTVDFVPCSLSVLSGVRTLVLSHSSLARSTNWANQGEVIVFSFLFHLRCLSCQGFVVSTVTSVMQLKEEQRKQQRKRYFKVVYFRAQIKLKLRPDWSLFGVFNSNFPMFFILHKCHKNETNKIEQLGALENHG